MNLRQLEKLLFPINFKIDKKFYLVEKPINDSEHHRWGVKMTLVSTIDEYVNNEGILRTPIGQLNPDYCLAKLTEKIFLGEVFEAFYRESKEDYRFVYENDKLEVKPVN